MNETKNNTELYRLPAVHQKPKLKWNIPTFGREHRVRFAHYLPAGQVFTLSSLSTKVDSKLLENVDGACELVSQYPYAGASEPPVQFFFLYPFVD